MSWQEYINDDLLGSKHFCDACIASVDDFSVWAKTDNLEIDEEQIKKLLEAIENPHDDDLVDVVMSNKHFVR